MKRGCTKLVMLFAILTIPVLAVEHANTGLVSSFDGNSVGTLLESDPVGATTTRALKDPSDTSFDVLKRSDGSTILVERIGRPTDDELYTISGHFKRMKRSYEMIEGRGEYMEHTCDTFTITAGNQQLIGKYRQSIKGGNTVNALDENGNVVINLDLKQLPPSMANPIILSTQTVTLTVKEKEAEGTEAEPCHSVVEITGYVPST